ncbi:MAG: GGDEF domain-containing protein [Proteobacteria bacterium]|nr:GGDEF domain-containing protein [Pseudomonadota bacterium]
MSDRPLQIVSFAPLPEPVRKALGGSFDVRDAEGGSAALAALPPCDLVLLDGRLEEEALAAAAAVAVDTAVAVVVPELDAETVVRWIDRQHVEEVLAPSDLLVPTLALRLQAAIERKRTEREARKAFATDLETGLPHQQQLIEHMSQLLALREREPAPMAVLALRVEGLASTQARLGREAANVLRRKIAVRLRAGVRASDVVASIGDDSFAVLLGSILSPADGERVGAKLLKSLLDPFKVAGQDLAVAVALGIGQFPQDGAQPEVLLRRAVSGAAATPAQGRSGYANFGENAAPGAANDE